MGRAERSAYPGNVAAGELDTDARDQLERADTLAARGTQLAEQAHRGTHVGNRGERSGAHADLREELEARRGDDSERAFSAEEQRFDVVTGVVFAQRAQCIEHP